MRVLGSCHRGANAYTAEVDPNGNKRAHAFCGKCGIPIYAAEPRPNPSVDGLRVGGAQFTPPTRQIWRRSALPWSMDLHAVERAERQ